MRIRIKINGNKIYKMDNFGRIETDILQQMYSSPDFTKKKSNVTESIENLLYKGLPVKNIYVDFLTAEIILEIDLDQD